MLMYLMTETKLHQTYKGQQKWVLLLFLYIRTCPLKKKVLVLPLSSKFSDTNELKPSHCSRLKKRNHPGLLMSPYRLLQETVSTTLLNHLDLLVGLFVSHCIIC